MGRIAKQVSPNTTRYYWYPGEKKEWIRAGIALGAGFMVLIVAVVVTDDTLFAVVAGTTTTAAVGGVNLGRRDARALAELVERNGKSARRAALAHTGRAAWRATVEGIGGAGAAVLIANLPARGLLANWLLPLVPAVVGACAHQAGMLYERLNALPAPPALAMAAGPATPQPVTVRSERAPANAQPATARPAVAAGKRPLGPARAVG